jgi:hypothetical protein
MSRARLMLLSLVVALAIVAVAASAASAAISFEWKVAGVGLKAGESKEFTINNDSKRFDLSGKLLGAVALLLATGVSVVPGARIIGGVPGTNEETAVFSGVTVDTPTSCTAGQNGGTGTVTTTPLITEIVESRVGGTQTGEVLILFKPKSTTSELFATFLLSGTSCGVSGATAEVTGLVLALPLPQKTEVLRQNLVFEAVTKEYRNHAGENLTAGLVFAGNPATLTGLVLVILNTDQAWGPF